MIKAIDSAHIIWAANSLLCLLIAGWAVMTDLRYRKIKNYTVLAGIAGGLALNITDIAPALAGMVLPLVLLILFALGMMGAGDVKLFCALGAAMGFPDIVTLMLYSFVICGIHIIIRAWRRRGLREMVTDIRCGFIFFLMTRKADRDYESRKRLPMAGSIAAAVFLIIIKQALQL